jgi:hypothetical protein
VRLDQRTAVSLTAEAGNNSVRPWTACRVSAIVSQTVTARDVITDARNNTVPSLTRSPWTNYRNVITCITFAVHFRQERDTRGRPAVILHLFLLDKAAVDSTFTVLQFVVSAVCNWCQGSRLEYNYTLHIFWVLHFTFSKNSKGKARGFQEVKFPRLHDNGTGWW